ncbi:MAG: hypothetical protein ACI8QQ_001339, partial [Psychroserpens sp.]
SNQMKTANATAITKLKPTNHATDD